MCLKNFKNPFLNKSGLNVFIKFAIIINKSMNKSNPIITPDVILTPLGGFCANDIAQNVMRI